MMWVGVLWYSTASGSWMLQQKHPQEHPESCVWLALEAKKQCLLHVSCRCSAQLESARKNGAQGFSSLGGAA